MENRAKRRSLFKNLKTELTWRLASGCLLPRVTPTPKNQRRMPKGKSFSINPRSYLKDKRQLAGWLALIHDDVNSFYFFSPILSSMSCVLIHYRCCCCCCCWRTHAAERYQPTRQPVSQECIKAAVKQKRNILPSCVSADCLCCNLMWSRARDFLH